MSAHDLHKGDPRQVLHDGCRECETRGKDIPAAIGSLDKDAFAAAYKRAADWQQGRTGSVISQAEKPLLRALWAFEVQLERRGFIVGSCPQDTGW